MSEQGDYWQQTGAFAFAADVEKRPLNREVKEAKGCILPNNGFLSSQNPNSVSHHETAIVPISDKVETLRVPLPTWVSDDSAGGSLTFATTLICAMYAKCGGEEAVLVVDGSPPVALLNPFGLAPMRDQPFIDLVADISMKLYTTTANDEGRIKIANNIKDVVAKAKAGAVVQSNPLLGSAVIVKKDTLERIGTAPFLQGFDLVWSIDYLGSKDKAVDIELFYNGAVYWPGSASNWMQVVRTISFTEDLNTKSLHHLQALDEEMRYRLLQQWQPSTFPTKEVTTTMSYLFKQQMAQHVPNPKKQIAIIEPRIKREVTYHEFDELSTKVALYLHRVACKDHTARFGVDSVVVRLLRGEPLTLLIRRCVNLVGPPQLPVKVNAAGQTPPVTPPTTPSTSAQAATIPNAPPTENQKRLAAVCALCAALNAFPDSVPSFAPVVMTKLAALTKDRNADIGNTIKGTLHAWWKSHRDRWDFEHKESFTEPQLEVLMELFISPSYYV